MIRSVATSKGAFERELFGSDPELSDIFDRYLAGASWEQVDQGFVVYVPTTFQARGLQRFQIRLEN
ncbi:MAG: hypothetical protein EBX52_14395, partial [Proteobacteria bacterium]|nr:hypothetical protein [Pseudomonadota bacterium]